MIIKDARFSLFFKNILRCNICNAKVLTNRNTYSSFSHNISLCEDCYSRETIDWYCNGKHIKFINHLTEKLNEKNIC